jgi:hypothetical protein
MRVILFTPLEIYPQEDSGIWLGKLISNGSRPF